MTDLEYKGIDSSSEYKLVLTLLTLISLYLIYCNYQDIIVI